MGISEPAGDSRMERKKEETRQKIMNVAIALFKQRGIEGTTMEQIALEADIAKGTLYHYFPSKEFIIHQYIQRSFQVKYVERVQRLREEPDTRSRLTMLFGELMEGVQAQNQIFDHFMLFRIQEMVSLHQPENIKSGLYRLGQVIIQLGQESGEIRSDISTTILEELVEFAFVEIVKAYYLDPPHFNGAEMISQCVDLILSGAYL